ncbi:MAG: amidohydrolase family protein [Acidimicrobiia bacterium]
MDLVSLWHDASAPTLPRGIEIWDAHTHTGANDPDGVVGTASRLLDKLADAGHAGAVVMSSMEPLGYPQANDRILKEAGISNGRLIPFLRVDPRLGSVAIKEAERCLALGARGIKMHPRGEHFALSHPSVADIGRVAAAHGVPILFHAGRGIPTLGDDALNLIDSVDGLNIILGHAGVSDLSWIGREAASHPGLFFDTAWWSTPSLLMLFATVAPDRILYASDTPYGSPKMISTVVMRVAAAAGYQPDAYHAVFGRNLLDLVEGRRPDKVGEPVGSGIMPVDPVGYTVYASFHAAITQILRGGDPGEAISLGKLAVRVPDDHPHAAMFAAVSATMEHIDFTSPRRSDIIRPLIVAAAAVLTPEQPLPRIA